MNEDLDKDLDKIRLIIGIDIKKINMSFIQNFRDQNYFHWKNIYDASFSSNCFTLNGVNLAKLLHNHGFLFNLNQMRLYNIATYYSSICFYILLKNHNCNLSINVQSLIFSDLSGIMNDKFIDKIYEKDNEFDTNYKKVLYNIIIGNIYNIYNKIDHDYTELNLLSCYNLYFKVILEKIEKIFSNNTNDVFFKDNGKLIEIIQNIYYKNDLCIKVLYNFVIYKYLFIEKLKYEDDKVLKQKIRKILRKIENDIRIYHKNIPELLELSIKYYDIFMLKCKDKLLKINVRQDVIDSNDILFSKYESYHKLILLYYENKDTIYQNIIDSDTKLNISYFNKLLHEKIKQNEISLIKNDENNYKKYLLSIYPLI